MKIYDVVIVGYGPVGACLGHLLGQCGLRVLILEREGAVYHLPRAVHFDGEVMRVFQWLGIAEKIEPLTVGHPGMRFVDGEGRLLLDWPRPQGIGPHGWRSNFRFHQPDLERILRREIGRYSTVDVRTRCEAFHIDDRGDYVDLRFEEMSCGKIERVRAKYVVGCDGARSTVRRYIETEMEDYDFHERWLVVDVILNKEKPELGDHSIQYCVPHRPSTYVRGPGLRRRWELAVRPEEDATEIVKPQRVWELLAKWIKPDEATIERSAVYMFHSLVACQWRKGRLFLAGDSCHQTPPFMGQGMCAGIRDVANLYWKLALVCQGKVGGDAAEQLLDSYEGERKPNAREYITTAVRLGGLINTARTEEALRAALPGEDGVARMQSIAPPLGHSLGKGEKAGRLFGQPRMKDGQLADRQHAHRFMVVAEKAIADGLRVPEGVVVLTEEDSLDAHEHLAQFGARAAVLRPDRYTLGAAESPKELAELVALIPPQPISLLPVQ